MKNQITISERENGKGFFLIGEDGYTTTTKTWKTREEAEKARIREQKLTDEMKPSRLNWIY